LCGLGQDSRGDPVFMEKKLYESNQIIYSDMFVTLFDYLPRFNVL